MAESADKVTEIDVAELRRVSLSVLCDGPRFRCLDRSESYFRTKQDATKEYDWDGRFQGYGGEADIAPGWFVPYKRRAPSTRRDLPRIVVKRITSMLFGTDRFPLIAVAGDEDAEDFVSSLSTEARVPARMIEARDLGGACGSVAMSFAYVRGKPRVEVHNAKHVTVLRWADRSEQTIGAAILAYRYKRRVFKDGKVKEVDFFHVRFWDETREVVWEPISEEQGRSESWWSLPRRELTHGFGFTPLYWIQNTPDAYSDDGESDYQGQEDNCDELNRLFSATTKGTTSNVDPTLIMRADPALNEGAVRKGGENVIWSPGGAEYLELRGTAQQAAEKQLGAIEQSVLDASGVVLADPEKLSGAAQSAAALRLIYAPMTALCDIRREQYGQQGVIPLLTGMLRAAKRLLSQPAETMTSEDGTTLVRVPALALPPRVIPQEDGTALLRPRVPGQSEVITLNWPPYFPATWQDISAATSAATTASGNKPVITRRTAIQAISSMWGVRSVDAELDGIKKDAEAAVEEMQKAMALAPGPTPRLAVDEEVEEAGEDTPNRPPREPEE